MTLTEFLLARIAEDREDLRRTIGHAPLTGRQRFGEFVAPGSVRARQEAVASHRAGELDGLAFSIRDSRRRGVLDSANLRHAAAAYADHPDYDEAWRHE